MRKMERARGTRPAGALNGLGLDLILGLRMLRKNWGLTLVGGLAMTVVIAVCATAFVLLETVGWSTLPLDERGRIVNLSARDPLSREQITSQADFELWRDAMKSVRQLAAYRTVERELASDQGSVRRVLVAEMTAAGFRVAGVAPLMGRTFLEEDEQPTAQGVLPFGSVVSGIVWNSDCYRERVAISCRPRIGHSDQECL